MAQLTSEDSTSILVMATGCHHRYRHQRNTVSINVTRASTAEQHQHWETGLGKK